MQLWDFFSLPLFQSKLSSEIRISSNLAETLEEPQLCPATQHSKKRKGLSQETQSFNLLNIYLQVS